MVERVAFEYAVLRVIPRVERGESINAGVLLYCRAQQFLQAKVWLDRDRARALDEGVSCDAVARALDAAADCSLRPEEDLGRRFRWLTAPRSTVVQPGPIHTGMTDDAEAALGRLFASLVLPAR